MGGAPTDIIRDGHRPRIATNVYWVKKGQVANPERMAGLGRCDGRHGRLKWETGRSSSVSRVARQQPSPGRSRPLLKVFVPSFPERKLPPLRRPQLARTLSMHNERKIGARHGLKLGRSRMRERRTSGSGAARLAAIPAGESPACRRGPAHVVVIPSGRAGDQSAGSLEVKALWGRETGSIRQRGASNLAGGNVSKPGSPERRAPREADFGSAEPLDLGEGHVGIEELDHNDVRTTRGHRGRHARQEWSAKARNRSWVA
jgi:hypothetical protein